MKEVFIGGFAISKQGHDFGRLYVIISKDNEYIYLVDGKIRTLQRPKKKKVKHVNLLNYYDSELIDKIKDNKVRDEDIKRALKLYHRSRMQDS
ncbi:MAG: hypothetical protein GX288_08745 [Clostridiales bacterium]|nr:hypothetical protein [Clostridiales bacterium]